MSSTKAEQYKQAVESWKRTPWPCYSLTPRPSPAQGNAAFAERDLDLALANFSTAIQLDPATAAYPLNRAAVYLKLREWTRAERDATTALELDGGVNLKAWFRRAVARRNLGNWELAKQGGSFGSYRFGGQRCSLSGTPAARRPRGCETARSRRRRRCRTRPCSPATRTCDG